MTVTDPPAVASPVAFYDEMATLVGERTLDIVERRRRAAAVRDRGWLVRRMLLAGDLVGLLAALLLAEWTISARNGVGILDSKAEILVFLLSLPVWVVVTKLYGLYERDEERADHSTFDDFVGVFHVVTVCTWIFMVGCFLTGLAHPHLDKLVVFWLGAIAFVTAGRALARAASRRHIAYVQNAVIVGAGDVGQLVARKLLAHPEYRINLVGFVDAAPKERRDDLENLTVLGPPEHLPAIIQLFDVERVIVAFSGDSHERLLELIRGLNKLDVRIDIVPRLFEVVGGKANVHAVEGLPLFGIQPFRLSRSSRLLKRAFDAALAAVGLAVLSPLLALIAFAIKCDSEGPILFRQVRMGAGSRTFRILKFRTMVADAEERKAEFAHLNRHVQDGGDPRMFKIPNDPRVTRVGRFLRRFSLDELPQLVNVLRGEMSLVGPRPLILDEDQSVSDWQRRRLDLWPGMTGLWQSLGASEIPFDEMVKLDYLYVTTWSLWNDLRLLFRTVPLVLKGSARG